MMCRSELRGLGAIHEELEQLGVHLYAISVDPPVDARRLAKRLSLSFPILCDTTREVVRAYGLLHRGGGPALGDGGEIAIPAQILIDRDGRILTRHVSKRTQSRLDPNHKVAAVRKLIK